MREQLQQRLAELKKDFTEGQARLQELEAQQAMMRDTLLRISGAIQVMEEMLSAAQPESAGEGASTAAQRGGIGKSA